MSFSDDAEAKVLDHVFGLATYTTPTLYLGVSTSDPTETGGGLSEPVGNGYARIATDPADWERFVNVVDNANELTFAEATGSWGTITHFALYDAASAGNLVIYGALATTRSISAATTLRFPATNLTFTLD
jgi:hypothetical protein